MSEVEPHHGMVGHREVYLLRCVIMSPRWRGWGHIFWRPLPPFSQKAEQDFEAFSERHDEIHKSSKNVSVSRRILDDPSMVLNLCVSTSHGCYFFIFLFFSNPGSHQNFRRYAFFYFFQNAKYMDKIILDNLLIKSLFLKSPTWYLVIIMQLIFVNDLTENKKWFSKILT